MFIYATNLQWRSSPLIYLEDHFSAHTHICSKSNGKQIGRVRRRVLGHKRGVYVQPSA